MLWYGMDGQTLKKIKSDILKKKFSKKYITEKYNITDEQFELICKWKLKISYKQVEEKISSLEDRVQSLENRPYIGSKIYCEEYGNGTIETLYAGSLMRAVFEGRELGIMCDVDKMVTVHDDKKRKIKRL